MKPIPKTFNVEWWSTGTTHFDVPTFIAGDIRITNCCRGDWCIAPESHPNMLRIEACETLYHNCWDILQDECGHLYEGRINSCTLALNLQLSKDMLQWSPLSWEYHVICMAPAWNVNFRQKGTMIYAIICNCIGKVYVS